MDRPAVSNLPVYPETPYHSLRFCSYSLIVANYQETLLNRVGVFDMLVFKSNLTWSGRVLSESGYIPPFQLSLAVW